MTEEKSLSKDTDWKSWCYAVVSGRHTMGMVILADVEFVMNPLK